MSSALVYIAYVLTRKRRDSEQAKAQLYTGSVAPAPVGPPKPTPPFRAVTPFISAEPEVPPVSVVSPVPVKVEPVLPVKIEEVVKNARRRTDRASRAAI